MDPLTHCLTGAMLAKSFPSPSANSIFQKRIWFWACVMAAELPDTDMIFYPLQLATHPFFYHRSFTHSFLGAPILGLILAAFLQRLLPGSFLRHWGVFSLCFLSHVIGDWLTSYGTPLFSPFSYQTYSLDLLSNLTLFPMAIFFLSLFLARKKPPFQRRCLNIGWTAFLLFLGISAFWQRKSFAIAGENTIASIPHIFLPVKWYAIQKDPTGAVYHTYSITLFPPTKEQIGTYPALHASRDAEIEPLLRHLQVKRYLHFNRWPVVRKGTENSESYVLLGNLLYRSAAGHLRGALKIVLKENGEVLSLERTAFKPDESY